MSTLPWGTLDDWQRFEVAERTARLQRRLDARARRVAQRAVASPVVRTGTPTTIAVSQADCAAAA